MSGRFGFGAELAERHHVAFSRLVARRALVRCFRVSAVVVIAIAGLAWVTDGLAPALPALAAGLAAGAVTAAAQWLWLPRSARRIFADASLLHERLDYLFDDRGSEIRQASGNVRQEWGNIVQRDEGRDIFALFVNRLQAFLIPRGQFDVATLDYVRSQLLRSGLGQPGRIRR